MAENNDANTNDAKQPDTFQQAWKAHRSQTRATIDIEVLRQVIQRDQYDFLSAIRLTDVIVVAVALVALPVWIFLGVITEAPWTWYLTLPVLMWNIVFTVAFRLVKSSKPSQQSGTLLQSVRTSIAQVEDRIWFERNLFWWNLLPLFVSLQIFAIHSAWLRSNSWPELASHLPIVVFLFLFFYLLDIVAHYCQRKHEPRRQELLTLLNSLRDETTHESPSVRQAKNVHPWKARRWAIATFATCLAACLLIVATGRPLNVDKSPRSSGPGGDALAELITELRNEKKLVGLAAMVMVDGNVEAAAAFGERKTNSDRRLEISDRWHLGGVTKSMTATMIARLIESGQMKWTDTVGDYFPNTSMHNDWKPVTLHQLLTDTAGAPANFSRQVSFTNPEIGTESTRARRKAVLGVISREPESIPGERHVYSNVGYSIAGAMAEKATGSSWSNLVRREIFVPLKLNGSGFGPPASSNRSVEQPRGHRSRLGRKTAVSDRADNTSIMGPAGIVHMTLVDLCTYATEHMRGRLGEGQLLSAESYRLLQTPHLDSYAYGWIRTEPSNTIPNTVYWHNGSNTMWYALLAFIPEKDMVVAVTSNDGDIANAENAAWQVVKTSAAKSGTAVEAQVSARHPYKQPLALVSYSTRVFFLGSRKKP